MWMDAEYMVHPNMRNHAGGAMSFGIGIMHKKLSKQKLNNKISRESELVGMDEYFTYNILLMIILEEQGYKIEDNMIYQDNQREIPM